MPGSVPIVVRQARETDAPAACDVLRRSIRELCVADHENDEEILSAWLGNKTPENVRTWIASSANFSVVAVRGDQVCGFGLLRDDGEIVLCYVLPEAQFTGSGRLMLRTLEARAASWGLSRVVLTSTRTAKSFYERNGYHQAGPAVPVVELHGGEAFPMLKLIAV